jgi:hypothetical protein
MILYKFAPQKKTLPIEVRIFIELWLVKLGLRFNYDNVKSWFLLPPATISITSLSNPHLSYPDYRSANTI